MTTPNPPTSKVSVVAQLVLDRIEANAKALKLNTVLFGDQQRIPTNMTVCVEPDDKRTELEGVPRRGLHTMQVYIIGYVAKVDSTEGQNALAAVQLGEALEDLLNAWEWRDMVGAVIHCYVSNIEPGYRNREGTKWRAVRVTFTAISKTVIGGPPNG
jgi:hypothetical protein